MAIVLPDASVKIALPDGRIDPAWYRVLFGLVEQINRGAVSVSYDNTTSGLTATDVQAALDEIEARVGALENP